MNIEELREKYGKLLTDEQQAHVEGIILEFAEKAYAKYAIGQQEHGGDLFRKSGLVKAAIEEAIDQFVYLTTIKNQIKERGVELGEDLPD